MVKSKEDSTYQGGFAVMRWLNDNNRLSVHCLKQVIEPKVSTNQFKVGMCGVSLFKGFPGLWNFRILALGDKKELTTWLDKNFESLTADATDSFCHQDGVSAASPETKSRSENVLNHSQQMKTPENAVSAASWSENVPNHPQQMKTPENASDLYVAEETSLKRPLESQHSSETSPKSPKLQGTEEKEQIKYLSSVEPQNDSKKTEKNFRQMEDDLKSLRRKYYRLEDRVRKLEEDKCRKEDKQTKSPKPAPNSSTLPAPSSSTPNSSTEKPLITSFSREEDVDGLVDVSHISGDQNIFKFLCLKIFSVQEIINGTRTGKCTAKCNSVVKPQLNPVQFSNLETLVLKNTKLDKSSFIKKFENLQKVLRKTEGKK